VQQNACGYKPLLHHPHSIIAPHLQAPFAGKVSSYRVVIITSFPFNHDLQPALKFSVVTVHQTSFASETVWHEHRQGSDDFEIEL